MDTISVPTLPPTNPELRKFFFITTLSPMDPPFREILKTNLATLEGSKRTRPLMDAQIVLAQKHQRQSSLGFHTNPSYPQWGNHSIRANAQTHATIAHS